MFTYLIRRLLLVCVCALVPVTLSAQGTTGPVLEWTIPAVEIVNVTRWQVCVDDTCADVTPTRQADEADNARFAYQFPAVLSVQRHTFKVKVCNALACVDSDDLVVGLPVKPDGLSLQ